MSDALFFAEPMRLCLRCHVKRPTLELEWNPLLHRYQCNRRAHCDALLETSLRTTAEQRENS